jgi:phage baseplate assembly protein gpV
MYRQIAEIPFNFLCPGVVVGSTVHVIPLFLPGDVVDIKQAWQETRILVDDYWKRWSKEYVLMLQERKKWKTSTPDLKVGQMVLLVSDDRPRDQWRLGVVDDLGAESDGRMRQVKVRLANGKTFRCHMCALVSLELE